MKLSNSNLLFGALAVLLAAAQFICTAALYAADDPAWTPNDRWFYCSYRARNAEEGDRIVSLIERAGAVDLNGMLWATSWDGCDGWSNEELAQLERIKSAAQKAKVEIVPILWSVGYGTMTYRNPNLAEGLPISDLPLAVKDGKAFFESKPLEIPNGDLETWDGNNHLVFKGFHDKPNATSFQDKQVAHTGRSSIRFENLGSDQHGHGRLMFELDLEPARVYSATIWVKADKARGDVLIQAYDMNGAQLAAGRPAAPKSDDGTLTTDWISISTLFRAPDDGKTRIYGGIWGGKEGTLWLDDLTVKPLGFVNPLQRPGTPIVVKSADGKTIYERGKDWELPEFKLSLWDPNSSSQELVIPEGSKIENGDKLAVDFYYPALVGAPQIGTCMSEPELYENFERSAKAVAKILNPQKWFLSMDEIRCAGTCKACRDRGLSLAEILADCIAKQRAIIKKVRPDADVYIWSDMLDPNHNAHDNYYVCYGDYTGVWDLIPKDLVISCWYYEKREESMKFFSERGFRTQGAAYYDVDSLAPNCTDWLDVCKRTPNCAGIMYTTWRNKYQLLEDFGKLVAPQK